MPLLSPHPQHTGQRLRCPRDTSTVLSWSSYPLHMWRCTLSTPSKVPTKDKSVCCIHPLLWDLPRIQVRHLMTSAEHILVSGWSGLLHSCECKEPTPSIPSKQDKVRCHTPAARHQAQGRRDFPPLELRRKLAPSSGFLLHKSSCKESILSSQSKQDTYLCCNPQPLPQAPASHTPLHCLEYTRGLSSWFRHHTCECTQSNRSTRCTLGRPLPHMIPTFPIAPNSRCLRWRPFHKHILSSSFSSPLHKLWCKMSTLTRV